MEAHDGKMCDTDAGQKTKAPDENSGAFLLCF